MFTFFRTSDVDYKNHPDTQLFINPGYWGEKLLSTDRITGYKEFDEDEFRERVQKYFDEWKEDSESEEDSIELWERINEEVLFYIDGGAPENLYYIVQDFSFKDFHFYDFFDEGAPETFTYHYIWCLYAIAWGIKTYDKKKVPTKSTSLPRTKRLR